MKKIEETVTITREITGPVRDLVGFVRYLSDIKLIDPKRATDEQLVAHARIFWNREHGEE